MDNTTEENLMVDLALRIICAICDLTNSHSVKIELQPGDNTYKAIMPSHLIIVVPHGFTVIYHENGEEGPTFEWGGIRHDRKEVTKLLSDPGVRLMLHLEAIEE